MQIPESEEDKYQLKACPIEYSKVLHEVPVFKPIYSLYQITQLVLFYQNISSENF